MLVMTATAALLALASFRQLVAESKADFTQRADPPHNRRVAHCRICRAAIAIPAGTGHGYRYDEYISDGYRYRFARRYRYRYICAPCRSELGEEV